MSLRKLKAMSTAYKNAYKIMFQSPSDGNFSIVDNDAFLNIDGVFQSLVIDFRGSVFIQNKLPDGYSIRIFENKIIIRNLMGRKINQDKIIFSYDGLFVPLNVRIKSFSGEFFNLDINNQNLEESVSTSETNFEDNTAIIIEPVDKNIGDIGLRKFPDNSIDDNTITGLNTTKPINGYTGKINYHPDEGIFMTGKTLSSDSKVLSGSTIPSSRKTNRVDSKLAQKIQTRTEESKDTSEQYKLKESIKPDDEKIKPFKSFVSTIIDSVQVKTKVKEKDIKTSVKITGQTKGGSY